MVKSRSRLSYFGKDARYHFTSGEAIFDVENAAQCFVPRGLEQSVVEAEEAHVEDTTFGQDMDGGWEVVDGTVWTAIRKWQRTYGSWTSQNVDGGVVGQEVC